ncbi:hypothetical protein ILT44_09880 [Microvirga sp. BT689]|uniref:hypothetical protein n=1 Tax=Microvirga arvi TaxID=2778731 RepID=UPI00194EBB88|nr:hypothetical protein [Microvirga arvi]MBM6580487.1 hypothetical protein [Microvirga arvi]
MGEWNQTLAQMDFVTMPDEETNVTFGDLDFDTIEAAVMETARGRWFLKEYARRNRNSDTQAVLDAVNRLREVPLDATAAAPLKAYLEDMAAAILQTKADMRSFPVIESDDPLSALSEAELQEAAEQRIRSMVRTLHFLESRIQNLIDLCKAEAARTEVLLEAGPFEGEKAQRLSPHPAFLM